MLLDGENKNEAVGLYAHFLCPSNIAAVFELRGVPAAPDYVSIDVDGYDPCEWSGGKDLTGDGDEHVGRAAR